jgi:hypothetical protein
MYRGDNSELIKIINPTMTLGAATTGLFDFDDTNKNCTYDYTVKSDSLQNQLIGITDGISPANMNSSPHKETTTKAAVYTIPTVTDTFRVEVKDNSATRVEIQLEAIERNGFFGAISRRFTFIIRRSAATTTIGAVTTLTDFSVQNSNANFDIDAVITTTNPTPNVIGVSIQITTSGAISPADADVRARVSAETTGTFVNTSTV